MIGNSIIDRIGNTPLVRLKRLPGDTSNVVLAKLEGNNPGGSVKDRTALELFCGAEARGEIHPGDTLIEATVGNTGNALAMIAAIKGYNLKLIMPDNMPVERKRAVELFGAQLITVDESAGMVGARDLAKKMEEEGEGRVLDQFGNTDNPAAHYKTTGPEIWRDTDGEVTHFVSAMGTRGTIMGVSRFLKEKNPNVKIVGVQPTEGSCIPGIRRWPEGYEPTFYDPSLVDEIIEVTQGNAEEMARELTKEEAIFPGISSGGAVAAALRVSRRERGAVIVTIICDRGVNYMSTGVFGSSS
jgi:cysteine synthase B